MPTLTPRFDELKLAHDIVTQIGDAGAQGYEGVKVLATALGVYMAAQEGAHREMEPLVRSVLVVAQITFDAVKRANAAEPGHA